MSNQRKADAGGSIIPDVWRDTPEAKLGQALTNRDESVRKSLLAGIDGLAHIIEVAGLSDALPAFDVDRNEAERAADKLLATLRELVSQVDNISDYVGHLTDTEGAQTP